MREIWNVKLNDRLLSKYEFKFQVNKNKRTTSYDDFTFEFLIERASDGKFCICG